MSVGFWMMKPELVFLGGREEAYWMMAGSEPMNDGNASTIDVNEESIREMARLGRDRQLRAFQDKKKFVSCDMCQVPIREHRKITRELPKKLRKMLARCKKETGYDFFELVISW